MSIASFPHALERTSPFGVDRATFGVAKRAGQDVAEFTANPAFHLISLTTIICGDHDVQQIVSPFDERLSNHLQNLGVKDHFAQLFEQQMRAVARLSQHKQRAKRTQHEGDALHDAKRARRLACNQLDAEGGS
jgi:hypothetical protein